MFYLTSRILQLGDSFCWPTLLECINYAPWRWPFKSWNILDLVNKVVIWSCTSASIGNYLIYYNCILYRFDIYYCDLLIQTGISRLEFILKGWKILYKYRIKWCGGVWKIFMTHIVVCEICISLRATYAMCVASQEWSRLRAFLHWRRGLESQSCYGCKSEFESVDRTPYAETIMSICLWSIVSPRDERQFVDL